MFRRQAHHIPACALVGMTQARGSFEKQNHPWNPTHDPKFHGPGFQGDRRVELRAIHKSQGSEMGDMMDGEKKRGKLLGDDVREHVAPAEAKEPATGSWEFDDQSKPIPGGTGPDNRPGVYADDDPNVVKSHPIEERYPNPNRDHGVNTDGKHMRSDNVNVPEFKTSFGKFERRRQGAPGFDYKDAKRQFPERTLEREDVHSWHPARDHHPHFDYTSKTGKKQGFTSNDSPVHWDLKKASHSLYRAALKGLPLIKQYYWVSPPIGSMAERVKEKFYQNKHVNDPEAIRNLIMLGWNNYSDMITFRMQKAGVVKFFCHSESIDESVKNYTDQEGKLLEERKWWEGEEQKKEGPYNGFWSRAGEQNHAEFQKLKGRIPMAWSSSKNYFEQWKCDGTNFWEKNLDYEGWFIKNVDPDRAAARKEIQNWVSAGYQQPKHYASKNRRSYRRMVKDIEAIMTSNSHDLYAASREQMFQSYIRDGCPETNRLYAEKKLARQDDELFTVKVEEFDKVVKQVMREMPNPRLWKTDAFYMRTRYLMAPVWEYNWAKAPIGMKLEKEYNNWVSDTINYVVLHSDEFAAVKACKKRNPMAKTWADFYTEYDPDVPETRRLPWYHPEFDFDRRHMWDEKCMRMKKWVASGDIDFTNHFFQSEVAKEEQFVNRPELMKDPAYLDKKYGSPRAVQLYRALMKRMDVAMTNQMVAVLKESVGAEKLSKMTEAQVGEVVAKQDWTKFKFDVPVVIYPDGMEQPRLNFDGTVVEGSA